MVLAALLAAGLCLGTPGCSYEAGTGRVATAPADTTASQAPDMSRGEELDVYSFLRPGRISPYDRIVKKYARRFGFDWRLISAQIYAESRFRPNVVSRRGAIGLMQVLPSTARHFNVDPKLLLKPEHNIALGCYFDRWLYEKWKKPRGKHRIAFMLASYNAGRRRILAAYIRAGRKPVWEALKPHVPGQTRRYVEKIFRKYEEYRRRVL